MANKRRSRAEREAAKKHLERWTKVEAQYRHRHRLFVMDYLPSMDEAHWKEYTTWVSDFSFLRGDGRKFNHQLKGHRKRQLAEMINVSIRAKERT